MHLQPDQDPLSPQQAEAVCDARLLSGLTGGACNAGYGDGTVIIINNNSAFQLTLEPPRA